MICLIRREGLPPRSAWRGIAVSGVLWFGFYMVVLNWGEQQVDAGTAALVVNIGPLLIALLGARLLGDAMPPRLLAGMAVSFAGAVTVGLSMSDDGGSSVLGVILCLLAAIAYAGGVVAQKPALGSATPLQVTTFGCFTGAVVCLPFAGQLVSEAADARPRRPSTWSTWAFSRPPWPSRRGPTRSPVRPPAAWAPPPTRFPPWSS